jgi:hypothetical protein
MLASQTVDESVDSNLLPREGWRVGSGYLDGNGRDVDFSPATCQLDHGRVTDPQDTRQAMRTCLRDGGVDRLIAWYQPAERFWAFQFIELGIVITLSVLSLGLADWAVRRRVY